MRCGVKPETAACGEFAALTTPDFYHRVTTSVDE
jgi:hypothetical protein